jgi:hypothetical protein
MSTEEELDVFRSRNLVGLFSLLKIHRNKCLVDLIVNELNHCKHIYTVHPNVFALISPHLGQSAIPTEHIVRLYETATRNMIRHHSRRPSEECVDRLCEVAATAQPSKANFQDFMMKVLDLAEIMLDPETPDPKI